MVQHSVVWQDQNSELDLFCTIQEDQDNKKSHWEWKPEPIWQWATSNRKCEGQWRTQLPITSSLLSSLVLLWNSLQFLVVLVKLKRSMCQGQSNYWFGNACEKSAHFSRLLVTQKCNVPQGKDGNALGLLTIAHICRPIKMESCDAFVMHMGKDKGLHHWVHLSFSHSFSL